jgi:hypothetical protein
MPAFSELSQKDLEFTHLQKSDEDTCGTQAETNR